MLQDGGAGNAHGPGAEEEEEEGEFCTHWEKWESEEKKEGQKEVNYTDALMYLSKWLEFSALLLLHFFFSRAAKLVL